MQELQVANQRIIYDPSFLSELEAENAFSVDYWQGKNAIKGSAQGRGTTWFIQLDNIQAALRHYHRGGLLGKLIKDSYLYSGKEKTRSFAEFNLLRKLSSAGVNVPKPIAARYMRNGAFYQADILTERVNNAQDLVSILKDKALPNELYEKVGREIKKMHQLQVNHTDLNIHNILVDNNEKVWLIDFDKCAQKSGETWKSSNLKRLHRSFLKEKSKLSIHFSAENFQSLITSYSEA